MPQPFNNAVMTDLGVQILTRAQAGEIQIRFTRIAVGNGVYTEAEKTIESLQERMALKSLQNSYAISNIDILGSHSVKVTALITNQDPLTNQVLVDQGYYINEIGLYAKPDGGSESEEVLYSIAVTAGESGDFMPPYNGYNPAQITQDYYITVNNSAEVIIESSGAAALAEDLVKLQKEVIEYKACLLILEKMLISGEIYAPLTDESGCILTTEGGEDLNAQWYLATK